MIKKTINNSLCNKCLECQKACLNGQGIDINREGYPQFTINCILCGHCFSVCPKNAINFEVTDIKKNYIIAESKKINEDPEMLLFSLRSIRKFNSKPVEKDKINKVLEAMIRSLSAGNEQNRNYYIVFSQSKLSELEQRIQLITAKNTKFLKNPFIRKLAAKKTIEHKKLSEIVSHSFQSLSYADQLKALDKSLEAMTQNNHYSLTNNAKAIIILTSRKIKGAFHESYFNGDVRNAITYGTIMAKMQGLGSCNLGLMEMIIKKEKSIQKFLDIPKNEQVEGILGLGYSDQQWKQIPLRGPAKTVWL